MAAAAKSLAPPPSTFAELLRRSRFASYDPAIAQTYSAPPAHARRGDYGLKRRIPMPYKDSYITVNSFEHHAHFTDWNNAESLVKWVKKVEELKVNPHMATGDWVKGIGDSNTQWPIDSEFAENNYPPPRTVQPPRDRLGQSGPGAYGARRPPPQTESSESLPNRDDGQLNVYSLSPREFKRYVEKIRSLAPKYRQFVLEQIKSRQKFRPRTWMDDEKGSETGLTAEEEFEKLKEDELLLYTSALSSPHKLHRRFLARQFWEEGENRIQRQPHPNAGLMYTHYSVLDTTQLTKPQPGFVLQVEPRAAALFGIINRHNHSQDYVGLVAGTVSKVSKANATTHTPFYNPDGDLDAPVPSTTTPNDTTSTISSSPFGNGGPLDDPTNESSTSSPPVPVVSGVKESIANFRMTRLTIKRPPRSIVGYEAHKLTPKDHFKSMIITAEAAVEYDIATKNMLNPHTPGSAKYSACQEPMVNGRYTQTPTYLGFARALRTSGSGGAAGGGMTYGQHGEMKANALKKIGLSSAGGLGNHRKRGVRNTKPVDADQRTEDTKQFLGGVLNTKGGQEYDDY